MSTLETLIARWHAFWSSYAQPHRDPAALSFARLGLLGTRW